MSATGSGLCAAIFDFDFTLGDSSEPVLACFNGAFSDLGLVPAEPESIRRTIGLSLEEALERLTGRAEPEFQKRFRTRFVAHADRVMVEHTELLPGVRDTLDSLRTRGLQLAIVSTKYRYRIEAILEGLGVRDRISVIVGNEDVPLPKPDPRGLRLALESLEVAAGEAVYVGDHVVDAEAANRASIPFVGVLTGTKPEHELAGYPHLAILPSAGDLPRFLAEAGI